jgi:hypothetical protein
MGDSETCELHDGHIQLVIHKRVLQLKLLHGEPILLCARVHEVIELV